MVFLPARLPSGKVDWSHPWLWAQAAVSREYGLGIRIGQGLVGEEHQESMGEAGERLELQMRAMRRLPQCLHWAAALLCHLCGNA